MSSCQQWQDQFWLAVDGELDEVDSRALVAHVRGCNACREELSRVIRVQRAVLMDAVGSTGKATTPTGAVRSVLPVSGQPSTAPASGIRLVKRPLSMRIPPRRTGGSRTGGSRAGGRRASSSRFILPVAVTLAVLFVVQIISGSGTPSVISELPPVPTIAPSVTVNKSTLIHGVTLAHLTQAVAVRVDGRAAPAGAVVMADATVLVDGSARLQLNDGTQLQLDGGTQVVLHHGGQRRDGGAIGVQVRLKAGSIEADVTPQSPSAPLVFLSPLAEITVVGTALQVRHGADGSRIHVTHGQVRVTAEGIPETLLKANESLVVSSPVPAITLASLAVTEEMNFQGTVVEWRDLSAPNPQQQQVVAVPSQGDAPPHYKVVFGHPALCLNGDTTSLTLPLPTWNSSQGLTLFIVARTAGTGADGLERLASMRDATGERLAVVRSRDLFGLTAAGQTQLEVSGSNAFVLTCRWLPNGEVVLLRDHREVASTVAAVPGTLAAPVLDIARGEPGKHFEGNLFFLEVQQGVPTEVVLHQRIDELLNRYRDRP